MAHVAVDVRALELAYQASPAADAGGPPSSQPPSRWRQAGAKVAAVQGLQRAGEEKRSLQQRARQGQASPLAVHSRLMTLTFSNVYFLVLENSWSVLALIAVGIYGGAILLGGLLALPLPLVSETEEAEGQVDHVLVSRNREAGGPFPVEVGGRGLTLRRGRPAGVPVRRGQHHLHGLRQVRTEKEEGPGAEG